MAIAPIPSTRVGDLLVRTRLSQQVQVDQLAILRLQQQIATGRRYTLPSEDAPSALRAISLQQLIERKTQVQVNVVTSQSYLSATDTAVSSVSDILADIRASALGAAQTLVPDTERRAVAAEVERALQQIVDIGNHRFRGRFLFAGSRAEQTPYAINDGYVEYFGNEQQLQSYSDLDVLFDTNIHGGDVFGAIGEEIVGTADLNPHLTNLTPLNSLRGGRGITPGGAIAVSDGTNTAVVDLSQAATVADVARLIESNPPPGRTVVVELTASAFTITLDSVGGGNLSVTEVGGGVTARELGILETTGVGVGTLVGVDLNPAILRTTRLADLLGAKAHARLTGSDPNNDLNITASANGALFSGTRIQLVDDDLLQAATGLTAGDERAEYDTSARAASAALSLFGPSNNLILTATTPGADFNNVSIDIVNGGNIGDAANVTYNPGGKVLTIEVDDTDETTLATLVAALASDGTFTATPDGSIGEVFDPAAIVLTNNNGTNRGNTGNSGGDANTLYVFVNEDDTTSAQLATAINTEGTFVATLDPRDTTSQEGAGTGRLPIETTALTNGGSGETLDQQGGLVLNNRDQEYVVDISTAITVEDLLNQVNGAGAGFLAQINPAGNALNIRSTVSGIGFGIGEDGGTTATQLGLRSLSEQTQLSELNGGAGVHTRDGTDFQIVGTDGVTTLAVDISAAQTYGDVIDAINAVSGASGISARIAPVGNGIEIVEDNPTAGGQLVVQTFDLSRAAIDLGFIPAGDTQATASSPATFASGGADLATANSDLLFTAAAPGTAFNEVDVVFANTGANPPTATFDSGNGTLTIDFTSGVSTAADIRDAVNLEGTLTAALDTSAGSNDGSGIVAQSGVVATLTGGAAEVHQSADLNLRRNASVFDSLARLERALLDDDIPEIERAVDRLTFDIERLNFSRAEVGARQRTLGIMSARLEEEEIELRSALSLEIDTELTQAISDLTGRRVAYQASLQTAATLLNLSILDFL